MLAAHCIVRWRWYRDNMTPVLASWVWTTTAPHILVSKASMNLQFLL